MFPETCENLANTIHPLLCLCTLISIGYDDDDEEEEARAKANKEHQETSPDDNFPHPNDEPQMTNKEEPPSNASNEEVTHEQRRGYKYNSYRPAENLLTNIFTGIRTRSSL